jgi:hypothetical protein
MKKKKEKQAPRSRAGRAARSLRIGFAQQGPAVASLQWEATTLAMAIWRLAPIMPAAHVAQALCNMPALNTVGTKIRCL